MRGNRSWRALAVIALLLATTTTALAGRNFKAHLRGANEVPPVDTQAQGQLILKASADGTSVTYKLIVANLDDVTAAHLHLGVVGMNGPVVVGLFQGPIEGTFSGVLAEGTITADDLVGPLEGLEIGDLLDAIADGDIYTNVHTTAHPGGEIRGQVR